MKRKPLSACGKGFSYLFYLYFSISLSALSSPKALALLRASRALSFCFISPKAMPRMMKMSGS